MEGPRGWATSRMRGGASPRSRSAVVAPTGGTSGSPDIERSGQVATLEDPYMLLLRVLVIDGVDRGDALDPKVVDWEI